MINYLGPSVKLLRICGIWKAEDPKGFWENLYIGFKVCLQVSLLIYWVVNIYLMFSKKEEIKVMFGVFSAWFHVVIITILLMTVFFVNISKLKKLLKQQIEVKPCQLGWHFKNYQRKAVPFIVLYGKFNKTSYQKINFYFIRSKLQINLK